MQFGRGRDIVAIFPICLNPRLPTWGSWNIFWEVAVFLGGAIIFIFTVLYMIHIVLFHFNLDPQIANFNRNWDCRQPRVLNCFGTPLGGFSFYVCASSLPSLKELFPLVSLWSFAFCFGGHMSAVWIQALAQFREDRTRLGHSACQECGRPKWWLD